MKNLLVGDAVVSRNSIPVGRIGAALATAVVGASAFVATPALAQSGNTMLQLIEVMHENGSISDAQYHQLMSAARSENARPNAGTLKNTNAGTDNNNVTTGSGTGFSKNLGGQANAGQGSSPNNGQAQGTLANTNAGTDNNSVTTGSGTGFSKNLKDKFDQMSWAQKIKLTGDLRLRYEYNSNNDALGSALGGEPDDTDNRSRGRVRYRLGIIATPIDHLELAGGLASGGDNPRSTNQTFDNNFSTKPIGLDYAYGQYDFSSYLPDGFKLKGIAGKFKFGDYLWHPTDAMWDGDINPEGGSVHLAHDSTIGETFLNSGVWVIQEDSGERQDPYLWYVQGGQRFEVNNFIATLGGTYYGFEETFTDDAPDTVFQYGSGTNTTSQFNVVDVNGTIGAKFKGGKIEFIGQYLKNTHKNVGKDTGFATGLKASSGQWGMKYLYVDLDRNAVPDSYPDSDRFNGATGIKGHEVAVSYSLNDTVALGLDYYNTEAKFGPSDDRQNIVQTDLEYAF